MHYVRFTLVNNLMSIMLKIVLNRNLMSLCFPVPKDDQDQQVLYLQLLNSRFTKIFHEKNFSPYFS